MSISSVTGQFGVATIIGMLPNLTSGANGARLIIEALANPSLSFVPLYAEMVDCTREAAISTSMIMSQSEGKKQFVTDNIAPYPRVWTVSGYLKSLMPYLENTLFFKPTILLQKYVLDTAMTSRKTVPFKTVDGEIVDVLVKSLKFTTEPKNQSSVKVDVQVQELNYLTSEEGALADLKESVKKSMGLKALATIGAATVIATVAPAIGGLQ